MANTSDWFQGPDVEAILGGTTDTVAWVRDPAAALTWGQITGDAWGLHDGETFYGPSVTKPQRSAGIGAAGPDADAYGVRVVRKVAVETFPNVDPGDWPEGAVGIEYEPGGGAYSGMFHVEVKHTIDINVSQSTTRDIRVVTPPSTWPAAADLTAGDFPTNSELAAWTTRDLSAKEPSDPPLFPKTVAWDQATGDVTWLALPDDAYTQTAPSGTETIVATWLAYLGTVIKRNYTPPRHRFIFPGAGMWTQRQRHTAGGNAGGLPARQRHNRRFNGSWPERQRHKGI